MTKFLIGLFFVTNLYCATVIKKEDLKPLWPTGWTGKIQEVTPTEWIRVVTEGNGAPILMAKEFAIKTLRKKIIELKGRINRIDYWSGVEIRFSPTKDFKDYITFEIPRFTEPEFNIFQDNTWQKITFGMGNAKIKGNPNLKNLKYFGLYVQDNGKGIFAFDFTDIKIYDAPFKGVLSYTFDDGYDDDLQAANILKKYKQSATAYIIPRAIGTPSYLTVADLNELVKDGWDISSHHETAFNKFPPTKLLKELDFGFEFFKNNSFSTAIGHLAFPEGIQNESYIRPIMEKKFLTARIADGGMETLPPANNMLLKTFNVNPQTTVEELKNQVKLAKENNQWLILMFHFLVENPKDSLEFGISNFEKFAKIVHDEGIEVLPVSKVYQLYLKKN